MRGSQHLLPPPPHYPYQGRNLVRAGRSQRGEHLVHHVCVRTGRSQSSVFPREVMSLFFIFVVIPFYLQSVLVHSANCVKT
jgi:hypothetical protein